MVHICNFYGVKDNDFFLILWVSIFYNYRPSQNTLVLVNFIITVTNV